MIQIPPIIRLKSCPVFRLIAVIATAALFLFVSLFAAVGQATAATYVSGAISQDTTWTLANKNKIGFVSDTASVVDVWTFEMTDSRDDENEIVIFDNAIGFNDFRKTANQIALTPSNLDKYNSISRNLGDNRGHGLHPSLFGPGGN